MDIATLQRQVAADPALRAALIDHPRETLQSCGVSLPESLAVRVLEVRPTEVVMVLPPFGESADAEMSEVELGSVAGGMMPVVKEFLGILGRCALTGTVVGAAGTAAGRWGPAWLTGR